MPTTTPTTARLPRATPESQGVDRAALARLAETLDGIRDVHSLMVLRHGVVVAEEWWHPYAPDEPHTMFSVSKSFTATAVGLAVDEGLLRTDDRVIDLLPDDAPADPGDNLAAMTVRDLLTMTSGHGTDTMNFTLTNLHVPGPSWAQAILAAPVTHEPGTRFVYNTGATYLLSAILHRLTGERLLDYLTPRLLAPLGIAGATWEQCPQGIDVGGYGLRLTTEDLAVFGQLLLQRGTWRGEQLVPAAWVDEMTAAQVPNGPDQNADWEQGYGYQFWRCRGGAYRADGAFGQFCVVWPERDAVAVLTSGTTATATELEAVLECLRETAGSAPDGAPAGASRPDDDGAPHSLGDRTVALPRGASHVPLEDFVRGSAFTLGPPDDAAPAAADGPAPGSPSDHAASFLRWRTVAVDRDGDEIVLSWTVEDRAEQHVVRCGVGRWVLGRAEIDGEDLPGAGAAAWTAPDELTCRLLGRGTPFALDVRLTFGGDGEGRRVEVAVDQNVSFGPTALLRATGIGAAR
ncbi:beta-lactamase family protein [Isoptericola sp. S6320L]|uniref:serine hydrolase domain-containing protein n=1 Tax=Isoptericola sp. S6320L TaxID=2926411 RepID=UPI001FF209D1|nr:serine hydrolase domain-containing protein [Isoptericola sp. S6320L]MCK0116413.1 beta-lactamase family protein [Isoptericola sp. S6320L]